MKTEYPIGPGLNVSWQSAMGYLNIKRLNIPEPLLRRAQFSKQFQSYRQYTAERNMDEYVIYGKPEFVGSKRKATIPLEHSILWLLTNG